MKQNYTQTMKVWLCALVLALAATTAWATGTGSTYYYSATAKINPSGSGKVYVATAATDNPDYRSTNHAITGSQYSGNNGAAVTFYWYAQANDGYIFKNWVNNSGTQVSTSRNFNTTETITSTNQNSRTAVTYTAVFERQTGLVKVASSDNSRGVVDISNPNNVNGETVTITATPDVSNGVTFIGWRKGNNESLPIVSTDIEYTLTASTETEGTYYAFFSEPEEYVFIRLKNVKTGRFLSICGTQRASNHTANSQHEGFIFTNSLKMISADNAQGNPSTVFLRNGTPSGVGVTAGANLSAQGASLANNATGGLINDTYKIQFNRNADGETFRIYTTMSIDDAGTPIYFQSYLCDEGTDYAVMKSALGGDITDRSDQWYVYVLGEDQREGAFGANTKSKFTKDGKYYTTMYTTFPYQLLDGVKAYYLPADIDHYNQETHTASFAEVESRIVPANTAVILECLDVQYTSGTEVNNRLLPLTSSVAPIVGESLNMLKGFTAMNNNSVANDKNYKYVLSYANDKLGFFHSSSSTMSPYKAYLQLPETPQANEVAQRSTFQFGEDMDEYEPTGINVSKQIIDDNEDNAIYDLQGRRFDHQPLPRGIYVKNGKKILIK